MVLLPDEERPGASLLVRKEVLVSGDDLSDAYAGFESQSSQPAVMFTLNGKGAAAFARVTRENIGKPFAIVLDNKVVWRRSSDRKFRAVTAR